MERKAAVTETAPTSATIWDLLLPLAILGEPTFVAKRNVKAKETPLQYMFRFCRAVGDAAEADWEALGEDSPAQICFNELAAKVRAEDASVGFPPGMPAELIGDLPDTAPAAKASTKTATTATDDETLYPGLKGLALFNAKKKAERALLAANPTAAGTGTPTAKAGKTAPAAKAPATPAAKPVREKAPKVAKAKKERAVPQTDHIRAIVINHPDFSVDEIVAEGKKRGHDLVKATVSVTRMGSHAMLRMLRERKLIK